MTEIFDASDPDAVRERTKKAKLADKDRGQMIAAVMDLRQGRAWIRSILEGCHVFHSPFAADAHKTAFNVGEQNVGLRILADIMSAAPDQYIQMMKESEDEV